MLPDPRLREGGMGRGRKREGRESKSFALAKKGTGKWVVYSLIVLVCNLINQLNSVCICNVHRLTLQ